MHPADPSRFFLQIFAFGEFLIPPFLPAADGATGLCLSVMHLKNSKIYLQYKWKSQKWICNEYGVV